MATLTKEEKAQDLARAVELLGYYAEDIKSGNALVLVSADYGKGITDYFRVTLAFVGKSGQVEQSHLTWAVAKALGYSLRDRNGFWFLAISGGGFSKPDEIARSLARFYGVERVRYELA